MDRVSRVALSRFCRICRALKQHLSVYALQALGFIPCHGVRVKSAFYTEPFRYISWRFDTAIFRFLVVALKDIQFIFKLHSAITTV